MVFPLLLTFFFITGIALISLQQKKPSDPENQDTYLCTVTDTPKEREKTMRVVLHAYACKAEGDWMPYDENIQASFRKDQSSSKIQQGDRLIVRMVPEPVKDTGNPDGSGYITYLHRKNIYRKSFVDHNNWQKLDSSGNIKYLANKVRMKLVQIYETAGLCGNELAVISALTLGYKDGLDNSIQKAYSASGAMHILAVSGLHAGIIYLIINSILQAIPFLRKYRWLKTIILLLFLWAYTLITGMSPSVIRAITMLSFIIIGQAINRKTNIYNSIAASAFILLIIRPSVLFEVGFQLSYMAVISIVLLHPPLYRLFAFRLRFIDKLWNLTCVSLAAQIGTTPIVLYYFQQFPTYSVLTNFIAIPGATIILYSGLFLLACSFFQPLLEYAGYIINYFIHIFNWCIFGIEKLPGSIIAGIRFQALDITLYFGLLTLIFSWYLSKRKTYLFLSGLLCLAYSGSIVLNRYMDLTRQQMIVYNIPGGSLIQFINGSQNVIWHKTAPDFDPVAYTRTLQIQMQTDPPSYINLDSVVSSTNHWDHTYINRNFIYYMGKRIAVFTKQFPIRYSSHRIDTDIVVLTQNTPVEIDSLNRICQPEMVVIDQSNHINRVQKWKKDCRSLDIRCHVTNEDGAFIVSEK